VERVCRVLTEDGVEFELLPEVLVLSEYSVMETEIVLSHDEE